ncbi:cell division protein FtsQ/DivIB [Salisediminibacterium beveridgei]|uniref:Cell division protein FtsQ n=1 Tax=Salisediminibacterium beveridgei TaxID=632773 RepID=A0A1D7QW95_9BACI|nr:FtsQ-type POTRA domain-containing protein [Salisediminibacterium beveridgei]AOM83272.1 Cell division protein FtsQ [Salisediminibacterium beveridgei]
MKDRQNVKVDRYVPDFRERRRKQTRRRLITYLCILLILLSIIWYFQSELSYVGDVHIFGNERLAEVRIMEEADNFENVSMWSSFDETREAIVDHPVVSMVTIERQWPRSLQVKISEYETSGYIQSEETGDFKPLLENGMILEEEDFRTQNAQGPVIRQMSTHPRIGELAEELHQLDGTVTRRISEIVHEPEIDDEHLTLYMTDGFIVNTVITSFAEYMQPYPAVAVQLNPEEDGILHMRMTPYFESSDEEEEEIELEE